MVDCICDTVTLVFQIQPEINPVNPINALDNKIKIKVNTPRAVGVNPSLQPVIDLMKNLLLHGIAVDHVANYARHVVFAMNTVLDVVNRRRLFFLPMETGVMTLRMNYHRQHGVPRLSHFTEIAIEFDVPEDAISMFKEVILEASPTYAGPESFSRNAGCDRRLGGAAGPALDRASPEH